MWFERFAEEALSTITGVSNAREVTMNTTPLNLVMMDCINKRPTLLIYLACALDVITDD